MKIALRFVIVAGVMLWGVGTGAVCAEDPIDFQRDVRPLLAEHCWKCHGQDAEARRGGLRLDERAAALRPAESGKTPIVPGKPMESELVRRIASSDDSLHMPPPESGRALNAAEIETLRRWIAAGAEYRRHWAYEPLRVTSPPSHVESRNPIDTYVADAHRSRNLSFASEADRATLLRRVSLDLTGLPPTREDRERLAHESYEETVDRLLSSPALGERLAIDWLDAARYADTDGYFGDKPRQMWLWRDWTIRAFNEGMPYDRFTVEQLAGDLLPNATMSQRVATGFNRNHMSNDETGLIDEEFRVEYVFDRVETTMSTWLGMTAGCAQCHDHKYDPLSQREYYQLFALFNNVPEKGLLVGSNAPPKITVLAADEEAELRRLTAARVESEQAYAPLREAAKQKLLADADRWRAEMRDPPAEALLLHLSLDDLSPFDQTSRPVRRQGTSLIPVAGIRQGAARFDATQHLEADLPEWRLDAPWSIGLWLSPEGSLSCPLSKIESNGDRRGMELLWQKGRLAVNLVHRWGVDALEVVTRETFAATGWRHVAIVYHGPNRSPSLSVYVDGRPVALDVKRSSLTGSIATDQPLRIARRDEGLGYYGMLDEVRVVGEALPSEHVANWASDERLRSILEMPFEKRSAADSERLLDAYLDRQGAAPTRAARENVRKSRAAEQAARDAAPTALVMEELSEPRATHVLARGRYDKPGERVEPGIPAAWGNWPTDEPRNRLGFARWLVGDDCPLAARVAANRLWALCFGEGLVRTPHDFGVQGASPTHPELLDYLALRLRESQWDWKSILRLIVTSRTYRQRSFPATIQMRELDPGNRWLTSGPRTRLSYEMLRDQALAVSGVLVRRVGGPSVKPYQPPGLWEDVSYNGNESYEVDKGEDAWRRSVYTYVKRQSPPPGLLLFDGPTREKCVLKRPRTNTPLQSLVLLNEETFWAAARELARHSVAPVSSPRNDAQAEDRRRIVELVERVLVRTPDETEVAVWREHLHHLRSSLAGQSQRCRQIVRGSSEAGESDLANDSDATIERACWIVLAHTLLNLDETAVRP